MRLALMRDPLLGSSRVDGIESLEGRPTGGASGVSRLEVFFDRARVARMRSEMNFDMQTPIWAPSS
jgi:hypothetical protein